jgi:hypothetical protein
MHLYIRKIFKYTLYIHVFFFNIMQKYAHNKCINKCFACFRNIESLIYNNVGYKQKISMVNI